MPVYEGSIEIETRGGVSVVDITAKLAREVERSGIRSGIAVVHVAGATGAVTAMEYEPGLVHDLTAALERLFPRGMHYRHHERWHDDNGHSHIRASMIGPSLTIPVRESRPVLGRWQQVVFIELDTKPRRRTLVVQIVGE